MSTKELPLWWIETMEYLRTVSGTVYSDQLKSYVLERMDKHNVTGAYNGNQSIVDFLNSFSDNESGYGYIKTHALTGEIYTVPYMRKYLDPAIKKEKDGYIFNKYLYEDEFKEAPKHIYKWNEELFKKIVIENNDKKEIVIDFSCLEREAHGRIYVERFDLDEIFSRIGPECESWSVRDINAQNIVFIGKALIGFDSGMISYPEIKGVCDFSESTFVDGVDIFNLVFAGESSRVQSARNLIDFRNTRCFKSVKMRNVKFCGNTYDSRITFEDSRISGDFEMINSDIGHGSLYCFQTVFGEFLMEKGISKQAHCVILNNINFENDARIDFVDTEMGNGLIKICNIAKLPETDLCFAPEIDGSIEMCPDIKLTLVNCNILNNLTISNVAELSFEKSKNYGRIIDNNGWRDTKDKPDKKYRKKTKGIGRTTITNKLLLAVYNYSSSEIPKNILGYNKAKDFVMLKENFVSQGMYDEEDTAFLLYMEYKPYIDSYNKTDDFSKIHKRKTTTFLYNLLYASGKYGISPTRVGVVLALTVLVFSMLYFMLSILDNGNAFSIGNVALSGSRTFDVLVDSLAAFFPALKTESIYVDFVGSFFYSLQNIVPFVSQFEPYDVWLLVLSAIENFIGTFMIGYFSVAVIRKTLR